MYRFLFVQLVVPIQHEFHGPCALVHTGLATYNTFDLRWKPSADRVGWADVILENYKCLDAKTGEEMPGAK